MSERRDLIVIGGGPAGAAAAIRARAYGLDALVLEAAEFPRHHVGESLVNLWSVFELLGVADQMDAGFQHKYGSCRIWGRDPELKWTWFDASAGGHGYSLQVRRDRFDSILLERARAVGAVVRERCRVTDVIWQDGRALGVRYRGPHGEPGEVRAPWLIDASGREGLIARRNNLRRIDPYFPDLSVYGYFRGATRFDSNAAGNLLIEAVPWGWLWFIPLGRDEVSVGLVCDGSTRPRLKALGLRGYFKAALAQSRDVGAKLAEAELIGGPTATASRGYASDRYAGPGWLTVGDAASFVDPMWATGVANAMVDGILAPSVVEAALDGRMCETQLVRFYSEELRRRADFGLTLVRFVYRANRLHGDQPFWVRRQQQAGLDEAAVERAMHRLARDPSIRYFRQAFGGMGVDESSLTPLDCFLARSSGAARPSGPLVADPRAWIPKLRSNVALYPWFGLSKEHYLVDGLAADRHGVVEFARSRTAAAALRLADGSLTADQLTTHVARQGPADRQVRARFEALSTLAYACDRDLIDLRPAATSH